MSGVSIEYKGSTIATIEDTGSKTLKTQGKYCEGDILVEYEAPPAPQPTLATKQITANGTYAAEDDNADGYSEVEVAVPREITKLVDGTITEYVDDEVSTIMPYTFFNRLSLNIIQFDNAVTIGISAFSFCPLIHPVGSPHIFPNILSIDSEGFARYNATPPYDIGFYFPKLISMGSDVWRQRYAKVILKQQCALVNYISTSFSRTVYYVLQRYFNWYTTATNWSAAYSAYPNSIQTIEDNIDYLVGLGYDRSELLKDEEVPTT